MKKNNLTIKILVACHKADAAIRQDNIYMPIQVGKSLHPELDLGFQCDNTGENISEKNGSYCELTALYWAWKNLKDVDYIGLAHYRRYFSISTSKMIKILKKDKIIIPQVVYTPISVLENFSIWTSLEDVHLFIDTIIYLFPEYTQTVIDYYIMGNRFSVYNMFVMSATELDNYCRFLFSILFELEKRLFKYPYSRQNRILGYLSETLLLLWLRQNNTLYKAVPLIDLSVNKGEFAKYFHSLRENLAFIIGRPRCRFSTIKGWDSVVAGFRNDKIELRSMDNK